jgi:hypothetical protein
MRREKTKKLTRCHAIAQKDLLTLNGSNTERVLFESKPVADNEQEVRRRMGSIRGIGSGTIRGFFQGISVQIRKTPHARWIFCVLLPTSRTLG